MGYLLEIPNLLSITVNAWKVTFLMAFLKFVVHQVCYCCDISFPNQHVFLSSLHPCKKPILSFCFYDHGQISQEIPLKCCPVSQNRPWKLSKVSNDVIISSLIFPHILPVRILWRYAIGCPPVCKSLLMERLQVSASKFDGNLWSATDIRALVHTL